MRTLRTLALGVLLLVPSATARSQALGEWVRSGGVLQPPAAPAHGRAAARPRRAARAPAALPDSARLLRTVRELADPRLEGRGVGTAGIERAADLVEREMRALGLAPAGDDGTWDQPLRGHHRRRGRPPDLPRAGRDAPPGGRGLRAARLLDQRDAHRARGVRGLRHHRAGLRLRRLRGPRGARPDRARADERARRAGLDQPLRRHGEHAVRRAAHQGDQRPRARRAGAAGRERPALARGRAGAPAARGRAGLHVERAAGGLARGLAGRGAGAPRGHGPARCPVGDRQPGTAARLPASRTR